MPVLCVTIPCCRRRRRRIVFKMHTQLIKQQEKKKKKKIHRIMSKEDKLFWQTRLIIMRRKEKKLWWFPQAIKLCQKTFCINNFWGAQSQTHTHTPPNSSYTYLGTLLLLLFFFILLPWIPLISQHVANVVWVRMKNKKINFEFRNQLRYTTVWSEEYIILRQMARILQ